MQTTTEAPYHVYANGHPITLLVFGPYESATGGQVWDVEIHESHFDNTTPTECESEYTEYLESLRWYITTVSNLPRNTHIVADCRDIYNAIDWSQRP